MTAGQQSLHDELSEGVEQLPGSPFAAAVMRQQSQPSSPGGSPGRIPTERSRSLSGMLLGGLQDRQAVVSKTYVAMVSKASEVLELAGGLGGGLSSLGSSLSRRRSPPPAPPRVLVPVRLLEGGEAVLLLPPDASLQRLQQECTRQAGVPLSLQRLCIEERQGETGLVNLLRTTAGHLSNRDRLARTMMQWVNYLFLPESVNAEIKGAGLISWANDNVWAHLAQREPGSVQVSVALLNGRRWRVQLPDAAPFRRLQEAVERQTGLPPERQAFFVQQQRPYTRMEQAFWAGLRGLLTFWRALFGAAASALGLLFSGQESALWLQVRSKDGQEVCVRLRGDVTLQQIQEMMEQQHGEGFQVRSVAVLPGPASGGA